MAHTITHLYVAVSADCWDAIKQDGRLINSVHFDSYNIFQDWLKGQFETRCNTTDTCVPVYCYMDAKSAYDCWRQHSRFALLKVKVGGSMLMFDDEALVSALNGPLNDDNPKGLVCWRKEDWDLYDTIARDQGIASCERMFDYANPTRDIKWCGRPIVRAFIPYLTRDMVVRVKVFRHGVRVRRPLRFLKKTSKL